MKELDQYKRGEMSERELESFTDKFMRAKFDNDRKKRWQNILEKKHNIDGTTENTQQKKTKIGSYIKPLAIAATILILLFLRLGFSSTDAPSYSQLTDQFLTEEFYENRTISKGDQDIEQLNIKAIYAYNQRDFSEAIRLFEIIVARQAANDEQVFFLGLSYLYNEQHAIAITQLQQVTQLNTESKYIEETCWFLALAYLKNGDLEKGKILLESITEEMWNYDKAQQLLSVL